MLGLAGAGPGVLLAAATLVPVDVEAQTALAAADQRAVLLRIADLIEDRYVIEDTARALAEGLRRDAAADRWSDMSDPKRSPPPSPLICDRHQVTATLA